MNNENIEVITDREELYDKCENIEQLFDNYYLPLLDKHYSKTYRLQQENEKNKHYKTLYQSLKKQNDELKEDILFCLKSIKQEMEMSKDSRTRGEMKSCYEILERWNK